MEILLDRARRNAQRIPRALKKVSQYFFVDKNTQRFIDHNRRVWRNWASPNSENLILCDFYGIPETEVARSYFLNILAKKFQAQIKSFSDKPAFHPELSRIYASFNSSGNFVPNLTPAQKEKAAKISAETLPKLKSKSEILDFHFLDIWLGIDIYETFLARFNEPTVNLADPRFIALFEEGIGLALYWDDYFRDHPVKALVMSHDCYLKFGVITKIAFRNKVPVYLPNPIYINYAQRPHSIHTYFPYLRQMFQTLSPAEQAKGKAWAKAQLQRRFKGEVGVDMHYSTASAFTPVDDSKRVLEKSDRPKVLICSHCFFDNPHAYDRLLFADFHEWLCFLGELAGETNYDWYLKLHPDPLPGTIRAVDAILAKYPRIKLLPYSTSHLQIVKDGINFVLTAYGTVGHEYPALGVPVINAGYNPRVAYDFNYHPKSMAEYREVLLNLPKLKLDMKLEDIEEFYYMIHKYVQVDDFVFPSFYELATMKKKGFTGAATYALFLDHLTEEKHREIIANMESFIDSGESFYFTVHHRKESKKQ